MSDNEARVVELKKLLSNLAQEGAEWADKGRKSTDRAYKIICLRKCANLVVEAQAIMREIEELGDTNKDWSGLIDQGAMLNNALERKLGL